MQSGEQTPETLRFHLCVRAYSCRSICSEYIFMYHVSHLCHAVFLMLETLPDQLIVAVSNPFTIDVFVSHGLFFLNLFISQQADTARPAVHAVQSVHPRFFCFESVIHSTPAHDQLPPLLSITQNSTAHQMLISPCPKVQSDSAGWLHYACQSQSELVPIDWAPA